MTLLAKEGWSPVVVLQRGSDCRTEDESGGAQNRYRQIRSVAIASVRGAVARFCPPVYPTGSDANKRTEERSRENCRGARWSDAYLDGTQGWEWVDTLGAVAA
jgi:hypothetical protein